MACAIAVRHEEMLHDWRGGYMTSASRFLVVVCLVFVTMLFGQRYAIVVSDTTNGMPGWSEVVDSLVARHNGQVFIWQDSVQQVKDALSAYMPDHIAFVGRGAQEINVSFVERIWGLTRELDADPYGDAIWGVITGYDDQDAMRIVQNQTLEVKTVLGGTNCTWDNWFYQGISTFEAEYNRIRFKTPDSSLIIDTVCPPRCPDDRCTLLVNYLNDGLNDTIMGFDIQGPVDYFITSGHGNVNLWQLHYPTQGFEGYFVSNNGQVYGSPYLGANCNINSTNPKIYNAMGNCLIGNPGNIHYMPYAWLHTGGAIAMTGYMPSTAYGYMLWGLGGLFQMLQDTHAYAEVFFINNQELIFDYINNTPGIDPSGLDYDRNACCYYGDPAADLRMFRWREPWWDQGLDVIPGGEYDTMTFWIEANYDSVDPGFSGTSGRRHPFAFLPHRYDSSAIIDSNCLGAVITDNFVLMYCWRQGDQRLANGERRYVTFVAHRMTGMEEYPGVDMPCLNRFSVMPSITRNAVRIDYELTRNAVINIAVYDATGRSVGNIANGPFGSGIHSISWDLRAARLPDGVYLIRFRTGEEAYSAKVVLIDR
jgi:hypothetical protein